MPDIEVSSYEQAVEQFTNKLTAIIALSQAPITDQASLVSSGNAKISLESFIKAVEGHFDPELSPLEERVKRLKNAMSSLISPAKMAKNVLVDRQRAWMAEEKRKAEAEERRRQEEIQRAQREKADRERREADAQAAEAKRQAVAEINREYARGAFGKRELAKRLKAAGAEEEAAKATAAAIAEEAKNAPPPVVTVQPNIPKVAGVKNQTYYFAAVENEAKILFDYDAAVRSGNQQRATFLSRFIMVDEAEVGAFARETKDDAKVMAQLPGVRAWSKG